MSDQEIKEFQNEKPIKEQQQIDSKMPTSGNTSIIRQVDKEEQDSEKKMIYSYEDSEKVNKQQSMVEPQSHEEISVSIEGKKVSSTQELKVNQNLEEIVPKQFEYTAHQEHVEQQIIQKQKQTEDLSSENVEKSEKLKFSQENSFEVSVYGNEMLHSDVIKNEEVVKHVPEIIGEIEEYRKSQKQLEDEDPNKDKNEVNDDEQDSNKEVHGRGNQKHFSLIPEKTDEEGSFIGPQLTPKGKQQINSLQESILKNEELQEQQPVDDQNKEKKIIGRSILFDLTISGIVGIVIFGFFQIIRKKQ